ncbi:MAG: phage tail sheath subtilisin-like domain-containing protein [Actinobacteria bacterium]|nr:phage tail sheath subtilisin-like domain-containing protein [Actinomycetota bacterium]
MPPTTVMGGVMTFNDRVAYPWYAPAGLNRGGISSAIQTYTRLTHDERDDLYENNVNPLASFPGQGVVA